ncbi:MAG: hypothetical protein U1F20_09180 [Lysobacterales bacterium]
MSRIILAILMAVLSMGWIFPMWLGTTMYLQAWQSEGWAPIAWPSAYEFSRFLYEAKTAFEIAFCWLALSFLAGPTATRFIQRHKD